VRRSDGEATQKKLLKAALGLFRKRGFDATTMRQIAEAAGMSLGAAYHYFDSKEAIVLAYYAGVQEEHEARWRAELAALPAGAGMRERVGLLVHSKIDVIGRDRKLMGAVFRGVGDPDSEVSVFGAATSDLRKKSIDEFAEVLAGSPDAKGLPADVRALLPSALWALHMGLILYLIHDRSRRWEKTTRLADGALDVVLGLTRLAAMPGLEGMRAQITALLRDAGLAPRG
jgi:AcrR family transcriptional regulator